MSFSSDRTHENAVKRTITKIDEVFLIPSDASPVTTYWSGGGTHILLPLEVDPAKYPIENNMTLAQTVPGRDLRYASLFTAGNVSAPSVSSFYYEYESRRKKSTKYVINCLHNTQDVHIVCF